MKTPNDRSVGLVVRHSIIKNKIDIFLIEVEILDKITDIIIDMRNKVYLKSLSLAYIFLSNFSSISFQHIGFLMTSKQSGASAFDTGFLKKLVTIYSSSTLHTSIKLRELLAL